MEGIYTMLSAYPANAEGTAFIVQTKEHGDVLVSPERSELWKQFHESGIIPNPAPQEEKVEVFLAGEPMVIAPDHP